MLNDALLFIAVVARIPFIVLYHNGYLNICLPYFLVLLPNRGGIFIKKLFKVIAFIFILNFIMVSSLFGWVAYSVIVPSIAGTGITVMDLIFNKNIDTEKAQKIQQNIDVKSAKLGNEAADKVLKGLSALFVPSNVSEVTDVK